MYNSIREFNEKFPFKQYIADMYGVDNYEYKSNIMIPCPFHAESTASLAIYDNSYYCFGAGCEAHGSSYDYFVKALEYDRNQILNIHSEHVIVRQQHQVSKKVKRNHVSERHIRQFNIDLLDDEEKLSYLFNRHFTYESVEKSNIGYCNDIHISFAKFNAPRYVIPVYDENKKLVTARYRIDPVYEKHKNYKWEPKYLAHPNCDAHLYNSHIIHDNKNIVVVGSEFDAAFLFYRYGIFAIAPPGEGAFKTEWISYFNHNHNILIWLDYDYAGMAAAIRLYDILKTVCNVKIYTWSNEFKSKDDVCDFVTKYSIFGLIEELDKYGIKAYS